MLNAGLLLNLCFIFLLVGCSFQASRPAPVENISHSYSKNSKGHIKSNSYKVKKGDTLYSISWAAGKDFSEIAKLNQLDNPYTIYPGQILYLTNAKSSNQSKSTTLDGNITGNSDANSSKSDKKQLDDKVYQSNAKSSNDLKKTLDQKAKPAYLVTSSQQNVNQLMVPPTSTLPASVSQWQWPVRGS